MSSADPIRALEARIRALESRVMGPYPAFVADNADPQKRGRLKLVVPALLGTEAQTGWAEAAMPYGGTADMGTYRVPPVTKDGDGNFTTGVWVTFRGGNLSYPVWFGTFWGAPDDTTEAPGDTADADPDVHIWRTMSGHSLIGVDTSGSERVELHDAAGQSLVMTAKLNSGVKRDDNGAVATKTSDVSYGDLSDTSPTVVLTDFAGNALTLTGDQSTPTAVLKNTNQDGSVTQTVTLSGGSSAFVEVADNQNNTVRLDSAGITIKSSDNSDTITLGSSGISISASAAKVSVDGQTEVSVTSSAKVSVSAPQVQVSGDAQVSISGGLVSISGDASVKIEGALISLN